MTDPIKITLSREELLNKAQLHMAVNYTRKTMDECEKYNEKIGNLVLFIDRLFVNDWLIFQTSKQSDDLDRTNNTKE